MERITNSQLRAASQAQPPSPIMLDLMDARNEIATLRRERDEARAQVAALKVEVNAGRAMWSAGAACDDLEKDDPLMESATDNLMSTIEFYDEVRGNNEAKGIG